MTAIADRDISDRALPQHWKMPLALTGLVLGWVVFGYWTTVWSMVSTWARSETFAHGFAVVPIVLWLVWRQREAVAEASPRPSRPALLALLPIGCAWLAGSLAAANAAAQLAFVALLAFCIPALLGWQVARKLVFPLGFLVFAVPFGDFLIPQLMDWTARFAVLGLRLSRVPVFQDGLDFVIPSGHWSVVEACSGIRYLIAALMVGTLFAYLNYRSLKRRLVFVAVAAAVPLVANWVRAYLVVMIGHLSGNRLAMGVDHLIYGWLFFGVVIALLFLIGFHWAETGEAAGNSAARDEDLPAGRSLDWGSAGLVALVAVLPALAMAGIERVNRAAPPILGKNLEVFTSTGWQAVEDGLPDWRPAFQDASDSWHQVFEKDGRRVGLHIGYYRNQGYGHKLAGGLLSGDDRRWILTLLGLREMKTATHRMTVNPAELRPRTTEIASQPLVAWYWYWAGGSVTSSALKARLYSAWSRLLGQGDDAAVIVLYGPEAPGEGEATLEAFGQSAGASINCLLNETRLRR